VNNLEELLRHAALRCSPATRALAEAAAAAAAALAETLGLDREAAAAEAALAAAARCLGAEKPTSPLAHDALEAAKLGAAGTLALLEARLERDGGLHAALAAAAARQLAAAETAAERLCLPRGVAEEALHLSRLAGSAKAAAILLLEEAGARLHRHPATGLPAATYPRCPRCGHGPLETRIGPGGCPRPGLLVEQRCPSCGWRMRYRVCRPPGCPSPRPGAAGEGCAATP